MKIIALSVKNGISKAIYTEFIQLITAEKKESLTNFLFKRDAERTLIAELLVRLVVIENFGIKNPDIQFGYGVFRKPFIIGLPDFHFNLSHSGDWVICAYGNEEIGIDVELINDKSESFIEYCFSNNEYQKYLDSNESDRLLFFYKIWTLKESYLKLTGKGFYHDLKLKDISFISNSFEFQLHNNFENVNVFSKTLLFNECYTLGVSSYSEIKIDIWEVIDLEELYSRIV